ncbi:MAG: hypothetical protein U0X71_02855 [Sphingobacteriaceae bacterium]
MKNNSKLMLGLALAGTLSVVACKKKEDVKPAPVAPTPAGSVTPTTPVGPATPTTSKFQVTSALDAKGFNNTAADGKFQTPQFSLNNAPKEVKQFVVILQGDEETPIVYWMARFSGTTKDVLAQNQKLHGTNINISEVNAAAAATSKALNLTLTVFALKTPLGDGVKYYTKDASTFKAKYATNIIESAAVTFETVNKVELNKLQKAFDDEVAKLKAAEAKVKADEAKLKEARTNLLTYINGELDNKGLVDGKKDAEFIRLNILFETANDNLEDAKVELRKIVAPTTPITKIDREVTLKSGSTLGTVVAAVTEYTSTSAKGSKVDAEDALNTKKTALGIKHI